MTFRALVVGAAVLLASCATQTPYAPRDATTRYGYSETRIETNRFRVSFSGNSLTDQETVETYLLYHAAELTLQQDYDWFETVDRDTEARRHFIGDARPYRGFPASRFHYRYYHPGYGWYPWYDPFWNDATYREVSRYEAIAEIFLGRGEKPDRPSVYDAREVEANLASQISYPEN